MKYGNEISLSRIIENLKKFFDLKADKSSLSKVATSNSYNDLDNKPEIPDFSDKVNVSGDTMTGLLTANGGIVVKGRVANAGDDEGIVIQHCSNGFAGICLGGPSIRRSVFYLKNDSSLPFWRYNDGSTNKDIAHPNKGGTIALTSDIPSSLPANGGTSAACSGNSSTATAVLDYGNTSSTIKIGYSGAGLSTTNYVAAYGEVNGQRVIKDIALANLKTAMSLNNVNNTADSNKSVKYATSAGSAAPSFANNTWYAIGDDAYIGDHNRGGALCIKSRGSGVAPGICFFDSADGYKGEIYVNGAANIYRGDTFHAFQGTNGSYNTVYASGFGQQSSIRYKDNVEDMTEERAKKLLKLRPITFDYKDINSQNNCCGLIAEEAAQIDEYQITKIGDLIEGIDYSKYVAQLIKLCQIQQKEINELEARLEKLEQKENN